MYVILGGTGQVGSATARALLDAGQQVTIVTRNNSHSESLKSAGANTAVVDVLDVKELRDVFQAGKRAFLLNPAASPAKNTDKMERETATAIISALEGSGLQKVVAASTYGAFKGECCGDLTILYDFEQALEEQAIPSAINRAGYYMGNWANMIEAASASGKLQSFFPADQRIPMVAPADLGKAAARRLMSGPDDVGIEYIEGPQRYTASDVAEVFSSMIGRKVVVEEIAPNAVEETFRRLGFSDEAAASYACMTRRLIEGKTEPIGKPHLGSVTLEEYFSTILK